MSEVRCISNSREEISFGPSIGADGHMWRPRIPFHGSGVHDAPLLVSFHGTLLLEWRIKNSIQGVDWLPFLWVVLDAEPGDLVKINRILQINHG